MLGILEDWKHGKVNALQDADPEFSQFLKYLDLVMDILEATDRRFSGHDALLSLQIDVIAAVAEATSNILKHCFDDLAALLNILIG